MQQTNLIVEATLNTGEQPRILLANHQLVFFLDSFVLLLLEFDLFLDTWVDYLVKLCEELLIKLLLVLSYLFYNVLGVYSYVARCLIIAVNFYRKGHTSVRLSWSSGSTGAKLNSCSFMLKKMLP